jgi:plastocyanin
MLLKRLSCVLALSVLLASCGGGGGGGSTPTSPTPTTNPQVVVVQVQDNQFVPKDVTINPGDTVRWVRVGGPSPHTVTADDGSFDSMAIFQKDGDVFERTFQSAGKTFDYTCKAHYVCCKMSGSVRVGSSAPPGKY